MKYLDMDFFSYYLYMVLCLYYVNKIFYNDFRLNDEVKAMAKVSN